MFASIVDFRMSFAYLEPTQIVGMINEAVNLFEDITDKFNVFHMRTKLNGTYMIVAGLNDRSNAIQDKFGSLKVISITIIIK